MFRRNGLMAFPAAALLIASAGLAQQGTQPGQRETDRQDRDRIEQRPLHGERAGMDAQQPWGKVARGGDVIGATLLDINNENIGTINDLIINPRNGHVSYVILAHGGFLGIGAEHVAIPWQQIETRPDLDRTYQVNITQERLEQAPSFDEDNQPLLTRPGWFDSTDKFFGTTARRTPRDLGTGGWGMQGRLQEGWDRGEQTTISGTISNIDRDSPEDGMSEGLIVTVQTADGTDRLIHLGPAWYLEGQVSELREGQRVEIQAREIPLDDRIVVMAESVRLEEGTLALRDQEGRPNWDAAHRDQEGILAVPERDFDDPDDPGLQEPHDPERRQPGMRDPERDQRQPGMRDPHARDPHKRDQMRDSHQVQAFVRGSDLRGSNVRSWEEENIGTVNELAIDVKTGRVPFIIAGFGGFIGIGEEEVVLPWQALSFLTHEERFMLAVDEQLLRNAPRLERDQTARLEDPMFRREIYSHFGLDPAFAMYEHDPMPGMQERQPWSQTGQLQEQFSQGQEVEVRGTVQNVGRGEIMPGAAEAVFVSIQDREGQEHIVKLGPAWFLHRQDLMVRAGEEIAIEGRQIEVEGRTFILASTVRTHQVGLRLRDRQGQPRWDAFQPGEQHLGIEEPRDFDDPEKKDPGMEDPHQPDDPHDPGRPGTPPGGS